MQSSRTAGVSDNSGSKETKESRKAMRNGRTSTKGKAAEVHRGELGAQGASLISELESQVQYGTVQ